MMVIRMQGWTVKKVSDTALPLTGVFVHDERRNHNDIMTVINETIAKEPSHFMVKEGTFEMNYEDSRVYLSVTNSHVAIGFKLKEESL